tara:strand:+ start:1186 stop:1755 length:570 start_codon:yes stop_codon:yes gene_type:complete
MAERNNIDTNMVGKVNPFSKPTPGQSLTNDPENPSPWESPPEHTTVNSALNGILTGLFEEEERLASLIQVLASGRMDIAAIAQLILEQGFRAGKWNPDMMLLLAEPLMVILMALAERADIRDYEIYDGEKSELDEEDEAELMQKNKEFMHNSKIFGVQMPPITKESVPEELLETIEQADMPKVSLMEKQ